MMRHLALEIGLLAGGMITSTGRRALIAGTGGMDGLTPGFSGATPGTVDVSAIAWRADDHLATTAGA